MAGAYGQSALAIATIASTNASAAAAGATANAIATNAGTTVTDMTSALQHHHGLVVPSASTSTSPTTPPATLLQHTQQLTHAHAQLQLAQQQHQQLQQQLQLTSQLELEPPASASAASMLHAEHNAGSGNLHNGLHGQSLDGVGGNSSSSSSNNNGGSGGVSMLHSYVNGMHGGRPSPTASGSSGGSRSSAHSLPLPAHSPALQHQVNGAYLQAASCGSALTATATTIVSPALMGRLGGSHGDVNGSVGGGGSDGLGVGGPLALLHHHHQHHHHLAPHHHHHHHHPHHSVTHQLHHPHDAAVGLLDISTL
ncbi:MOB kinase activator-like 2 [Bactrocera tryoni]|uniref:MOB kinase activator-like 2 n=1 Tax=Bactrocera tryoni TaxID=59916 RepID=UPI001A97CE92|nr:MOB kinase activator-like 2 [Bactrocera tryoni]